MTDWKTGTDQGVRWATYDGDAPLDRAFANAPEAALSATRMTLRTDVGETPLLAQLAALKAKPSQLRELTIEQRGFQLNAGDPTKADTGRATKVFEQLAPDLVSLSLVGHFGLPALSHGTLRELRLTRCEPPPAPATSGSPRRSRRCA